MIVGCILRHAYQEVRERLGFPSTIRVFKCYCDLRVSCLQPALYTKFVCYGSLLAPGGLFADCCLLAGQITGWIIGSRFVTDIVGALDAYGLV